MAKVTLVLGILLTGMSAAHAAADQPAAFLTAEQIVRQLQPHDVSTSTVTPADRRGMKNVDALRQKRRVYATTTGG